MRKIGSIEDCSHAQRFAAHLATQGIACTLDGGAGGNTVWVHEEDRVPQARDELSRFQQEPDHERYRTAIQQAKIVASPRPAALGRARTINLRDRWSQPTINHCPVTFGLIAIMLVVAALTGLDPSRHAVFVERLLFSSDRTMNAIWSGEVWRLISPIFPHGDPMHLLFNLIGLHALGLMIEYRIGSLKFLGMVVVIAILSNYAQFAMVGGRFYGMSGVVYGLFGYAWVRGGMDPGSGIGVSQSTVTFMIGWQIMCMTFIPGVANWAHGGGLVVGAAMGASLPLLKSLLRR